MAWQFIAHGILDSAALRTAVKKLWNLRVMGIELAETARPQEGHYMLSKQLFVSCIIISTRNSWTSIVKSHHPLAVVAPVRTLLADTSVHQV